MAYRFNGTTDKIRFAIDPLAGYTAGPLTTAIFFKRSALSSDDLLLAITDSADALTDFYEYLSAASNAANFWAGSNSTGPTVNSTTPWYLLVVTRSGPATPRFHLYNGTSWSHTNGSAGASATPTFSATDRIWISTSFPFAGDIVCAGIKKTDSADAVVETLSHTSFQAWRDFGFDWLVGFEAAGTLADQGAAGTGDEVSRVGTTLVADPPGWDWATPPVTSVDRFSRLKLGTGLAGTDLGAGTLELDNSAPLPVGGTAGQVLTKDTSTDYDTSWQTPIGIPLFAEVATAEPTGGTIYVDLATVGPQLTVTTAGDYLISFGIEGSHDQPTQASFAAPKLGAATAVDADGLQITSPGAGYLTNGSRTIRRTLAAGTVVKLQYKVSANQYTFRKRWLEIRGI